LDNFLEVQNSNIYPIFRQKVPQNFWNMVIPPPSPPIFVQNNVKIGEKKLPQNFWIPVGPAPPPFWTMSERKTLFFLMYSLSEYRNYVTVISVPKTASV
jgi:hypothetical protein